jgi:hypothetical protein
MYNINIYIYIYIHRPDYIQLLDLANKQEEKSNLPVEAAGIFHAFSHSKILTVSCTSSHHYKKIAKSRRSKSAGEDQSNAGEGKPGVSFYRRK